ncbi:MAG TPA: ROK family protein [Streptosporangiaceae bacterium]|nr:ROK family protein [Streptosporangiaceae bacterium]
MGVGVTDMLFVALGAGVGAGLVLNNALYRGSTGAAGEIGLFRNATGTAPELERRVAPAAVAEADAARAGTRVTGVEQVFERAAAGEPAAREAVSGMVAELSVAIANAILLCNPAMVVIGGGLGAAGEPLLAPLRERVTQLVPAMPKIEPSQLGAEAAVVGAVRWATEVAQQRLIDKLEGGLAHA